MNRKSLSLLLVLPLLAQPLFAEDTWSSFLKNQIPLTIVSAAAIFSVYRIDKHYSKVVSDRDTKIRNLEGKINNLQESIIGNENKENSALEQIKQLKNEQTKIHGQINKAHTGLIAQVQKAEESINTINTRVTKVEQDQVKTDKNLAENYLTNEIAAKVYATSYSVYTLDKTASRLYRKSANLSQQIKNLQDQNNTLSETIKVESQTRKELSELVTQSCAELKQENVTLSNQIKAETKKQEQLYDFVKKSTILNQRFATNFWNKFVRITVNNHSNNSVKGYEFHELFKEQVPTKMTNYFNDLNDMKAINESIVGLIDELN